MFPQISATAFFCFGLAVLCIGYLIVEILWGKDYFWRESIERYTSNLFDRVVHYIIRGIAFNFLILIFSHYVKDFSLLSDLITSSGGIAQIGMKFDPSIVINIQMISFCVQYFVLMLIGFLIASILVVIGKVLYIIFSSKKKKSKK